MSIPEEKLREMLGTDVEGSNSIDIGKIVRHSGEKLDKLVEIVKRSEEYEQHPCGRIAPQLGMFRLHSDAILPTHATKYSACWDVYSIEDVRFNNATFSGVRLGEVFKPIRTGWRLVIPEGYRIDVRARSGLAAKQGITVLNAPGTIDHDYEGELMIILASVNDQNIVIKKGDRIAQIALERVQEFTVAEVSEDQLPVIDSERAGGLGSTGS